MGGEECELFNVLCRDATESSSPEIMSDGPKQCKCVLCSDKSTFQLVFEKN